jgi:membrane protease YdiL (CAAX protease family)
MKIAVLLFKQSAKTFLAWLVLGIVVAVLESDPGAAAFRPTDLLRAAAIVLISWFIYQRLLWLFQPSAFLADSLRFDARMIQRGSLFGAVLVVPFILLQFSGWFGSSYPRPAAFNQFDTVLQALTISLVAGVTEEIMFRGILLHAMEKVMGTWWACCLQAILFGLLHLSRPDVQWVDVAELASAGFLFGAAYVLTRNLWFTISLHMVYDWILLSYPGAIEAMLQPPSTYTTIEYFVLAVSCATNVGLGLYFFRRATERGHLLPPQWKLTTSLTTDAAVNEAG